MASMRVNGHRQSKWIFQSRGESDKTYLRTLYVHAAALILEMLISS
jgi:hypothetical protein